jgi:hypothetical protein
MLWSIVPFQLCTPSVPKCKHLLTFTDYVGSFVLFKTFMNILFILLWHVLSSYIFLVYHHYFYTFTNFLNKTNSKTCTTEIGECLYLETEGVALFYSWTWVNKDNSRDDILLCSAANLFIWFLVITAAYEHVHVAWRSRSSVRAHGRPGSS